MALVTHASTMASDDVLQRPYAYIDSGSIGRQLNEIHRLINSDPAVRRLLDTVPRHSLLVKSDLKTRVTSRGRLRMRRFYWSLQVYSGGTHPEFRARTLRLEPDQTARWYDFPDDPALQTAQQLMSGTEDPGVLQYVPFRRLTVLEKTRQSPYTVLKLKRPERNIDACVRLATINDTLKHSVTGFSLASNLNTCAVSGAQRQSYCEGRSLMNYLKGPAALSMVHQLGKRLADFHAQPGTNLPLMPQYGESELARSIAWLCAVWPAATKRIQNVYGWLLRNQPDQLALTLCHGDLSPDQILVHDDHWSLIDMDHAHRGSRLHDIARLLVRLRTAMSHPDRPVPDVRREFLTAYGSNTSDPAFVLPLRWYSCLSELEHLSTLFRKNLGSASARASCLDRAENHTRNIAT